MEPEERSKLLLPVGLQPAIQQKYKFAEAKESAFLIDEHFRLWDFKEKTEQDEMVKDHLMCGSEKGMGANDPSNINFLGHQRNFENVITALKQHKAPLISGEEAMKSVQLIDSIYRSAKSNGTWINL